MMVGHWSISKKTRIILTPVYWINNLFLKKDLWHGQKKNCSCSNEVGNSKGLFTFPAWKVNQNTEFLSYSWLAGPLGVPLWEVLSMVSEQCRVLVVKLQCQPLAVHFRVHIMGGCCLVEDWLYNHHSFLLSFIYFYERVSLHSFVF